METAWNSANLVWCVHLHVKEQTDWCQMMTEWWKRKERAENQSTTVENETDGERERGPDASWEGYLIYDITPLFPFSLHLVLHSSLPLTSLHVSTRAQTIFALSPPYPSLPTTPPMLPFTQKALFLCDPTINGATSEKVQKCKVVHLQLRARLQINKEGLQRKKLDFLPSVRVQQHGFLKGKHLRSSPLHSSSFGFSVFLCTRVEIVPRASCNSPRK